MNYRDECYVYDHTRPGRALEITTAQWVRVARIFHLDWLRYG